jgi:hypothetical protein
MDWKCYNFYDIHRSTVANLLELEFSDKESRDSSVGTAAGYGLDDRGSIPDKGKRYSLLHSV